MKTTLRLILSLCSVLISFAWGNPAPSTCSFVDPQFDELSHQKTTIIEPKQYSVGEENFVIIELEKPNLPSGYMISVIVDILKSPKDELEVQGWYPKTTIKPLHKGDYELSMRVNIMYKGS